MADIPGDDPIIEDQSQLPDPLPIFPLPNVVLMPNASLPLYIFEERYKEMVRDCLAGEPYLSVALLQKGWEKQPGTPQPYPVAGSDASRGRYAARTTAWTSSSKAWGVSRCSISMTTALICAPRYGR